MELITLSCGNCGAPLQVPDDAKYVTCNHCASQLAVRRTDTVTFTEKLDEISQRTQRIEGELSELKSRQELEDLDRQWEREREGYMIADKHGRRHVPTVAGSVFGGVAAAVFGVVWTAMAANMGGGGLAVFGVVFIVLGVGIGLHSYSKAQDYLVAERRYRRRRAEALRHRTDH
jgi:DNA-directed RNA polymerase subunit RPC12/RpoP